MSLKEPLAYHIGSRQNILMPLTLNNSAYASMDLSLTGATAAVDLCRGRSSYDAPASFNALACAMCFIYVYMERNVIFNHTTEELVVIGVDGAYPEGTRMKADASDASTVSVVCGWLKDSSQCWKWQTCCQQANTCCQQQLGHNRNASKGQGDGSKMCPRTWDGYACWDNAPAGHVARIPCPVYVPHSASEQHASKTCTENATWFAQPNGIEWTDYSTCSKSMQHFQRFHVAIIVCNTVTIALLIPAIITFLSYRPLRQQHRIRLHLCLMICSLVTALSLLIWQLVVFRVVLQAETPKENTIYQQPILCIVIQLARRYADMASFMWMFIEGFHLHRLLVQAFSVPKSIVAYYIFGFGFPFLSLTVYSIIRVTRKPYNDQCWVDQAGCWEWIIFAPILTALIINVAFLLRIVYIMVKQLEPHPNEPSNFRRAAKAVVVLMPVFGVHLLIFVYRPDGSEKFAEVHQLLNVICSSLQGSLIVLVFCYFNKEVQGHVKTSVMRLLKRSVVQESSSRSYTMTTHCATDSSRLRSSNGIAESSPMIQLQPMSTCSAANSSSKLMDDVFINGDLNTISENAEENYLLQQSVNS